MLWMWGSWCFGSPGHRCSGGSIKRWLTATVFSSHGNPLKKTWYTQPSISNIRSRCTLELMGLYEFVPPAWTSPQPVIQLLVSEMKTLLWAARHRSNIVIKGDCGRQPEQSDVIVVCVAVIRGVHDYPSPFLLISWVLTPCGVLLPKYTRRLDSLTLNTVREYEHEEKEGNRNKKKTHN